MVINRGRHGFALSPEIFPVILLLGMARGPEGALNYYIFFLEFH